MIAAGFMTSLNEADYKDSMWSHVRKTTDLWPEKRKNAPAFGLYLDNLRIVRIAVREMKSKDAELVARYFLDARPDFLKTMGVDPAKLPTLDNWFAKMHADLAKPMERKEFFYVIWMFENKPIGHSNINKIIY